MRRLLLPFLLIILVLGLALAPRLVATDVFVTTDELFWMGRSGNFARALAQGRYENTFQTGHPGVTTMWTAFLSLGQERAQAFAQARREISRRDVSENPDFVPALARARQGIGVVTALGTVAVAGLTWRLYGPLAALIGGGLLALDPFFLAHSRLLHIDAELSIFMTLAVMLALTVWSERLPQATLLLVGAASGLAMLAKAPAGILLGVIPMMGMTLTGSPWLRQRRFWVGIIIWGIATIVTYGLIWPALWAAPASTLAQVLGFVRDNANPPHALGPIGQERAGVGIGYYWYALLYRSSPITLAGIVLALVASAAPFAKLPENRRWRTATLSLVGFAILFGAIMTFAAKNFDRYLLPVFPVLTVVAGFGWASIGRAVAIRGNAPALSLATVLVAAQAWLALSTAPYYITYFNPLAGGSDRGSRLIASGWGEGLDQVAAFLNAQPGSERLRVALPGEIYTTVLGSQTKAQIIPAEGTDPTAYDYLVVYIRNTQLGEAPPFMDERYLPWQPQQIVTLNGLDYAWIYPTKAGAPVHQEFQDGTVLQSYTLSAPRARPGQTIQLALTFAPTQTAHTVQTRLTDSDGAVIATFEPSPATESARAQIQLPTSLPTDDYVLEIQLLDSSSRPIPIAASEASSRFTGGLRGVGDQPSQAESPTWLPLRGVEVRTDRR